MKRALLALLVVASAVVPAGAAPVEPRFVPPDVAGPDVPPVSEPVAVVTAFDGEEFSCAKPYGRATTIDVPALPWSRVIVEFTAVPDGDPWDRLFGVAIGGVEVLRGTTPRTAFTVRKDITEFSTLLPPEGTAEVRLTSGSYVGRLVETVRLFFYDDVSPTLVRPAAAAVVPALLWGSLGGEGARIDTPVTFPVTAAETAWFEVTMSGHGSAEAWFLNSFDTPTFDVFLDGTNIGRVVPMPYTYAFFGFGNGNANTPCAGPGTSPTGDTVHPLMWWTAQQGLDAAGVHGGVGEIPPYRLDVDPALLSGARTISIVQNVGPGSWPVSISFGLR
jgi:hypothetical protein